MATFEFAQFTATDKYIADQTSLNVALDATKNIDGLIEYVIIAPSFHTNSLIFHPATSTAFRSRTPRQLTSSSVSLLTTSIAYAYVYSLSTAWESVEHHLAITKDPKYPELAKNLHPYIQPGSVSFQHVKFNKDPSTTLFTAPVTEVAVITFKSGTSEETVKALEGVSKALDGAKGQVANAYGESVENKGVWIIVVGWESIEVSSPRLHRKYLCSTFFFLVGAYGCGQIGAIPDYCGESSVRY